MQSGKRCGIVVLLLGNGAEHNRQIEVNNMGKSGRSESESNTQTTTEASAQAAQPTTNNILTYRRDHPGERCSYGIAGVPGIVVFDKGLFADGVAPPTITLSCLLALPRPDKKAEREAARVAKAEEKARKAQERLVAQQAKAVERQAKAQEALAKAQAKAAAATSTPASA